MNDLELARDQLHRKKLTLVIVKNGYVLFDTASHRISGFLGAIDQIGDRLEGASIADRVVGKAIALLCVYAGIGEVYAEVLSQEAKKVFEERGINCEWNRIVDNILDLNRSSVCPFEKTAESISDPKRAYLTFKELLRSFMTGK
jgi:hypothetical protein